MDKKRLRGSLKISLNHLLFCNLFFMAATFFWNGIQLKEKK